MYIFSNFPFSCYLYTRMVTPQWYKYVTSQYKKTPEELFDNLVLLKFMDRVYTKSYTQNVQIPRMPTN